jgi:hypothetical protein
LATPVFADPIDYWAVLNREGRQPCIPIAVIDKSLGHQFSVDQIMVRWSPQGYKLRMFPLEGTAESVPLYWPEGHGVPLLKKNDCMKLTKWAHADLIPESNWVGIK